MTDFVALWASRHCVVEEVEAAVREADAAREQEARYAQVIQSVYRGHLARSDLAFKSSAATQMARAARGHASRMRAAAARKRKQEELEQALLDYCATMVQKTFRAFYSRQYTHSFYARQAYVDGIRNKSETLRAELAAHRAKQVEQEMVKAEDAARKEFTTLTQNFHHLVSTRSIPGVFNPPYATTAEEVPSAFGIPMETHLRIGVKSLLRSRGLRSRKGPPPSYAGARSTLRSQGVYGEEVEAERRAARAAKLAQVDDRPFTGGGTSRVLDPASTYRPSISQGVPYQAPWEAAKSTRELANTAEAKAKRVSHAPFVATVGRVASFEEVERTRSRERQARARRVLDNR